MTILAIMSILLALCGATVTGIKESRTAMADKVREYLDAAKEAFKSIDNQAGRVSQDGCKLDEERRKNKIQVHTTSSDQKRKFDRAHWWYERMIWIPLFVLILISILLAVPLICIPIDEFKTVVINPTPNEILAFRAILIVAFFLNFSAFGVMFYKLRKMRIMIGHLKVTATTLNAGDGNGSGSQHVVRADLPPVSIPVLQTTGAT